MAMSFGLYQYPPSSPVSSSKSNLSNNRDLKSILPLPSDGHHPFSNLPTAFRTKSWASSSEAARQFTEQSSSTELMRNGSFEAPSYRFSGLAFTPPMSLVDNYSAPLSITDSYDSDYQNYESRGFPVPKKNPPPYNGGRPDDRFTQRPFASFSEQGSSFRNSYPSQVISGDDRYASQFNIHRPPAIPSNLGYRVLNHEGNGNRFENQGSSMAGITVAPECTESAGDSPKSKQRVKHATCVSPNSSKTVRTRPSRAAQAAIAAGMTVPAAANEVPFDISDPPLTPVTPPSIRPVCSVLYDMNPNDILLGRGGGTNNQLGNQRFRTLVQQFQPTYLLSRRKDKPLIARSIVLIVRKRGGRFLRKDEGGTMLYEVGDEKAEAKTSQALREGLDVRANRTRSFLSPKFEKNPNIKTVDHGTAGFSYQDSNVCDQRDNGTAPGALTTSLRTDKCIRQDSFYYHQLSKPGFGKSTFGESRGTYGSSSPHAYPTPYYPPYTYIHPGKPQNFRGPNGHQPFAEPLPRPSNSYGPIKAVSGPDFHPSYFRDA